ncbi:MAG: hypothetical protein ACJASL_000124 [Paraglaciecola sp.]|jgi:hypothetical protein
MTYAIKGKQYTKFGINVRCAELHLGYYEEGFRFVNTGLDSSKHYNENFPYRKITANKRHWRPFEPATSWGDAGSIIDKCFDELMLDAYYDESKTVNGIGLVSTRWEYLMDKHKCTKLIAACICLIELNE